MLKDITTKSFDYLLALVFLIFSFYLIQDFISNKLAFFISVFFIGLLGYIIGRLLKNSSSKRKIVVLFLVLILYILLVFLLADNHNSTNNSLSNFLGEWRSIPKDNVDFVLVIKNDNKATISMSPNHEDKSFFKIRLENNCFNFYDNQKLDDFQWCVKSVNDSLFYIHENQDTVYFLRHTPN